MSFTIIYVTHKNKAAAKKISDALLKKKYIACVNVFPINSAYWWKGVIANEKEIVTLYKTANDRATLVEKEILRMHPYTTPCIIAIKVKANKEYEQWIHKETRTYSN